MSNTASASNENTERFCFDIDQPSKLTLRSFNESCGDTNVHGDSYLRLIMEGTSPTGPDTQENDDYNWPCRDSSIETMVVSGRYCLLMGCYAGEACSYEATIRGSPLSGAATTVPTSTPIEDEGEGGDELRLYTGVQDMIDTNSASNENAYAFCFNIDRAMTLRVQSFENVCFDTRIGDGDSYIRLRKDFAFGEQLSENDDYDWHDGCSDSRIVAQNVQPGRYCMIMGCYANTACSYEGTITGTAVLGGLGDGTYDKNKFDAEEDSKVNLAGVFGIGGCILGLVTMLIVLSGLLYYVYIKCAVDCVSGKDHVVFSYSAEGVVLGDVEVYLPQEISHQNDRSILIFEKGKKGWAEV